MLRKNNTYNQIVSNRVLNNKQARKVIRKALKAKIENTVENFSSDPCARYKYNSNHYERCKRWEAVKPRPPGQDTKARKRDLRNLSKND